MDVSDSKEALLNNGFTDKNFLNSTLILKLGGALLESEMGMHLVMNTVAALIKKGQFVIIVHGGGCLVEQQLSVNGMQTEKLNGLRITPKEQMPIITGALAGTANKALQAAAKGAGITAVGMSLADGDLVNGVIKDKTLGFVGSVTENNSKYLNYILSQAWLPIISSIAMDSEGNLLNVNADQAATAIAKMTRGKLILLSDVLGVLDAKGELVKELTANSIENYIAQGVIAQGMKVKVEAALEAANAIGQTVTVASWKDRDQMTDLIQGKAIGTSIRPD